MNQMEAQLCYLRNCVFSQSQFRNFRNPFYNPALGDVKEKELKGRLQMEETNSRLDELTNQIRELEKARKQASAEIERKEQEIKNQKSQLKETENQLKREQETCERLKKIKQERDSGMTSVIP